MDIIAVVLWNVTDVAEGAVGDGHRDAATLVLYVDGTGVSRRTVGEEAVAD